MKNKINILLIIAVLVFSGCSKEDQMTNYIPTAAPDEIGEATPTGTPEDGLATPTPRTVYVGQTTPMYVKLEEYDDFLNIRSEPSTDADIVGFLVHTEKIDVIEISDGWASFLYKDAICYVNADYLVDKKPDLIDPPSPTPEPKVKATPIPNADGPDI